MPAADVVTLNGSLAAPHAAPSWTPRLPSPPGRLSGSAHVDGRNRPSTGLNWPLDGSKRGHVNRMTGTRVDEATTPHTSKIGKPT